MANSYKKLYRSRKERMIAGVCGGLGGFLDADPVIIRLAFVILAIFGGGGILLYLIMWLIVPEELSPDKKESVDYAVESDGQDGNVSEVQKEENKDTKKTSQSGGGRMVAGMVVILIGFYVLSTQFFPLAFVDWRTILAVVVIITGFYLLLKNS